MNLPPEKNKPTKRNHRKAKHNRTRVTPIRTYRCKELATIRQNHKAKYNAHAHDYTEYTDQRETSPDYIQTVTDFSGAETPTQAMHALKIPHILVSALEIRPEARAFI